MWWSSNRRGRGTDAERRAARWLGDQGLTLRKRNYHCRHGEIDLIMDDEDALVFIEVRYRSDDRYGGAEASVTPEKQQRIASAARHFLGRHPQCGDRPCRFDVVAVQPDGAREGSYRYHWIRNAFYGDE